MKFALLKLLAVLALVATLASPALAYPDDQDIQEIWEMKCLLRGYPCLPPTVVPAATPTPAPPVEPNLPAPSVPASSNSERMGVNIGWVLADDGTLPPESLYEAVVETGAHWVRVDFILGPWSSLGYEERHQGHHWFDAYDNVVNGFTNRGIKVYALVGYNSVGHSGDIFRDYPGQYPDVAEDWIQRYAENFAAIVDHFRGRVRVYELYNEPNDWAGGDCAAVHPCWFARMLEEVYLTTKSEGDQVTIVSGPLLGHNLNLGDEYLRQTYACGIEQLHWEEVRRLTGSYPLDGIGYHPYVRLPYRLRSSLNIIWNVIVSYEGWDTPKRIWVSEIGWSSAGGEDFQAEALTNALRVLKGDRRVAAAFWYTLADYINEAHSYGLYRMQGWFAGFIPKPAFEAFREQAR